MGAGGRQLTNLMNKNYKEENYEREVERQELESVTPWITNIHFRHRIFILHVCITARSHPQQHPDWKPHPSCLHKCSSMIIVKKILKVTSAPQSNKESK